VLDPCTVIWSGNGRRQSQNFMRISPNLANQTSLTSASSSNKENHPSTMKLQDQHAITIADNIITPSRSTISILMATGLRKTGKRILSHLHKKGARGHVTRKQINTTKEVARKAEDEVMVEVHSNLHTAYTTTTTPTTAPKMSNIHRIQKKDGAKLQPVSATILI
jgi:ribosomal protein L31